MRLLYQPASQPPVATGSAASPRGSRGLYLGDTRERIEALYGRRALCETVIRTNADTRLTYAFQGCRMVLYLQNDRLTRMEIYAD